MSEEKKNLSLEELENVAGGVNFEKVNGRIQLTGANGERIATAASYEEAQAIVLKKGLTLQAPLNAAHSALQTKSPMDNEIKRHLT